MKRPSFQFYPGDWMNDAALRMVSVGARGLWIEMMCLMHQGSEYGYLKVNGKVILSSNLARMSGATLSEVEGYLIELESSGVFSRDHEGCIFSRRMIRDEKIRESRAAGGIKGGNPALLRPREGSEEVEDKVNLHDNLWPTPSSSSSSSSSSTTKNNKQLASRLPEDWMPNEEEIDFCLTERPDLNVQSVADQFRDYWVGVAGAKGRKANWTATWRNWVRNQRGGQQQGGAQQGNTGGLVL